MAYTDIDDSSAFFQTLLYTGDGNDNRNLVNTGNSDLQPDWIWNKRRDSASNHFIFDSIRGASNIIVAEANEAESANTNQLQAFQTNGFQLGSDNGSNGSNRTMVAWQWKAGTAFTNDASSTGIGSIDSAGSVNQDAGFSIVSYTNTNQSANSGVATIKHGLNTTPNVMILKDRDATSDWSVYHSSLPTNKYLALNKTDAGAVDTNIWNNTAPTSTVFTVGDNSYTNPSNRKMIGYIFSEKKGYSKFGSYVGNGNVNGSYIHLGFLPAFVMTKRTDGADWWVINDTKRDTFNASTLGLRPNDNAAESSDEAWTKDILSNGFKHRTANSGSNGSGNNYIYMAFAENPFVTSTGVPATAR